MSAGLAGHSRSGDQTQRQANQQTLQVSRYFVEAIVSAITIISVSLFHSIGSNAGGDDKAAPSRGWMGSFTSLFMQALFNVSVIVSNVVVKYTAPNTVSTATVGAIKCYTAADPWRIGLQVSCCCPSLPLKLM